MEFRNSLATVELLSAVQGSEGEVGRIEGVWRRQKSTAAMGHGGKVMRRRAVKGWAN